MKKYLPLAVGALLGVSLHRATGWWGFLVLFPWIGLSVCVGLHMGAAARRPPRPGSPGIGRRVAILLILPALLFFVPLVNRENFQVEGVVLLLTAAYFSKGVIHWAVAKVFGPLAWGRGFCGWACWIAAVLDWLPMRPARAKPIGPGPRAVRWAVLAVSVGFALLMVHGFDYDVRAQYIGRQEVAWMYASTALYYFAAVPLAYAFSDRRALLQDSLPGGGGHEDFRPLLPDAQAPHRAGVHGVRPLLPGVPHGRGCPRGHSRRATGS